MKRKFKNRIKYSVNQEKRTIAAYIEDCTYDAIGQIRAVTLLNPDSIDCAKMMNTYRAIAKCHPEDTFSENKGKEIAAKKLFDRYESSKRKAIARYINKEFKKLTFLIK